MTVAGAVKCLRLTGCTWNIFNSGLMPVYLVWLLESRDRGWIDFDSCCDAVERSSNLLRDAKHLKVADFGLSLPTHDPDTNDYKILKRKGTSCRYMAPELFQDRPYNKCVDVFSFALIVQEVLLSHFNVYLVQLYPVTLCSLSYRLV
jgi:serine/threonine protein kinase